jgi:hypothetical protein
MLRFCAARAPARVDRTRDQRPLSVHHPHLDGHFRSATRFERRLGETPGSGHATHGRGDRAGSSVLCSEIRGRGQQLSLDTARET